MLAAYPEATVACFDPTCGALPRRQLDATRTVRFLEALDQAGAGGLLIAASTGQGHLRTPYELLEWYDVAASAQRSSAWLMALLRPEDGPQFNRQVAARLQQLGYQVAFVRPGTDLPAGAADAEIVANMVPAITAAAAAGLAVGVYSIPDVSGVALSAEATAALVRGPAGDQIVAAKITEADYEGSTARYLAHPELSHLQIVQGWDPHLARALQDGRRQGRQRCGVTSGPMSFAVFQYRHLLAAARAENWVEVARSQAAVSTLFAAMQDDPQRFADLQRAKYIMGLGEPVTAAVDEEQVDRVFAALDALPRDDDRRRLAHSLDLLGDGPFHDRLVALAGPGEPGAT